MQTKIDKTFQIDEPIEKVWAFLSDPSRVVTCVPGAKLTETIDEHNYKGTVSMKVGPVVTNFRGDIKIEESNEAEHVLVLSGKGMDAKGKGSATMKMTGRLSSTDGGGTEVASSMEISVVGRLAQFGSRLMDDISNRMFEQFTQCFAQSLQSAEPEETVEAPAEEEPAATSQETSTPEAPEPATQTASAQPEEPPAAEPEPIKALPLLFSAIGSAIARFFKRLTGSATKS